MDLKTVSALLRASKDFSDKLRANVAESGLSLTEFSILEALYQKGELSVGALLKKMLVNSSTISYTINKLEKDGLISVCQDPHDKRVRFLSLTKQGSATIKVVAEKHYDFIRALNNNLTTEEEEILRTLLKKLNHGGNHGTLL